MCFTKEALIKLQANILKEQEFFENHSVKTIRVKCALYFFNLIKKVFVSSIALASFESLSTYV